MKDPIIEPKREQLEKKQQLSPIAQEKTYGERQYDFIFGTVINFWVNLIFSAAATHLVTHSKANFKLPFLNKETSLSGMQQLVTEKIHNSPPMRLFGENAAYDPATKLTPRIRAANTLANVLTLTSAGHFVMIPSVWLGAKIKAPLVRHFNRKHYGDAAMEDPTLKARHAAIEMEERPTLFGTLVGRAGSMVATQAVGYTIGNDANLFKWIGGKLNLGFLSKFSGLDHITGVLGKYSGSAVEHLLPQSTGALDKALAGSPLHMDWSVNQQLEHRNALSAGHASPVSGPQYQHATQHFGKYLAQDVLYSAVTAVSIAPAINFCKKFIPGMTYTPKVSEETRALVQQTPVKVRPHRLAENAPEMVLSTDAGDRPATTINQIHNHNRVQTAQEQQVTA